MAVVLTLVLLFHLVQTARARDFGGCSNTGITNSSCKDC